jgi:hypothetical protein
MDKKIVQYRLIVAEYFNALQTLVNEAIAQGWQPTGQLFHAEFQINPENMNTPRVRKAFIQAMVLHEGATPIAVPPPPAPLPSTPQPGASGIFTAPKTMPMPAAPQASG